MMSSQIKNVLVLDHTSKPSGGEIYLLSLLQAHDKQRFNVKVVLGQEGFLYEKLLDEDIEVEVIELPKQLLERRKENYKSSIFKDLRFFYAYANKIKKYIKEHKIDIVYTNSIKSDVYGSLAAKMAGVPCVWFMHDRLSAEYFSKGLARMIALFSRMFAKKVICNSESTKRSFVRAGGQANKAAVVLNGIDVEKYNIHHNTSHSKRVVMVGRIAPWKGQKVFIEAARKVLANRDDASFYIAGSVLFGEDDYKDEIEQIIADKYKISNRIYICDFVEDIPAFLEEADILVHASIIPEPFGLSVAEGMASGLPVIAADAGGIIEMISDNYDGLLYAPGNSLQLAECINTLLNDKELARKLGENARKTIEVKFNIKDKVKEIEDILAAL
jgi:glycosyltransferase involved in cell wall biosynthesis